MLKVTELGSDTMEIPIWIFLNFHLLPHRILESKNTIIANWWEPKQNAS